VAIDVRSSLKRALKSLHSDRARIDRQITAITTALGELGGAAGRVAGAAAKKARRARNVERYVHHSALRMPADNRPAAPLKPVIRIVVRRRCVSEPRTISVIGRTSNTDCSASADGRGYAACCR